MATIPAPMKSPVSGAGQATKLPATPTSVRPADPSAALPEVPVGVLEVPISVWGLAWVPGQAEPLKQFSEETCTVIVFPHGGVIRLSAAVVPGQMVLVANRNTHQEVLCRVTNVKKYPNVKGYVEVQFNQPTEGFWGAYDPQGKVKLPETAASPAAVEKLANRLTPSAQAAVSIPVPVLSPASIPAAVPPPRTPAAEVALTDDFWSSSFPLEILAAAGKVAQQFTPPSTTAPSAGRSKTVRNKPDSIKVQAPTVKASERSAIVAASKSLTNAQSARAKVSAAIAVPTRSTESTQPSGLRVETSEQQGEWKRASLLPSVRDVLHSWLQHISEWGAIEAARCSSRKMVVTEGAVVVLFLLGAAGFFFLRHGAIEPAADPTNSELLVASMAANTVQGVPPAINAANPAPVTAQPPIVAPTTSQPAKQGSDPSASMNPLQPASQEPAPRKRASAKPAPNQRFSFSHAVGHLATTPVRSAPPDLALAPLSVPGNALPTLLSAGSKIFAAQPSNPLQVPPPGVGGRLKEAQLLQKTPPNYPVAAKQTHLEGTVLLRALLDVTGNVSNVEVVSGPPLLRNAAVEAVSKWKYSPRYLDDKPVPAETFITIEFRLH